VFPRDKGRFAKIDGEELRPPTPTALPTALPTVAANRIEL
jgi:hypothetical protein